jgi:hypothetical protein
MDAQTFTPIKSEPESGVGTAVLAWLIPGLGFWKLGLRERGILLFVLIQMTFLVGCGFRGSVLLPDLQGGADGFNIVSVLVFVISMGNGGLGILSLLADLTGGRLAVLPSNEAHSYADLGQMYLLVSGGLNYFLVMTALTYSAGAGGDSQGRNGGDRA